MVVTARLLLDVCLSRGVPLSCWIVWIACWHHHTGSVIAHFDGIVRRIFGRVVIWIGGEFSAAQGTGSGHRWLVPIVMSTRDYQRVCLGVLITIQLCDIGDV